MLPVSDTTIRVFLHVLAATIWVGGQITLAALVPTVRGLGEGATAAVARRFDRVAWPAFGVLVATGVWNLLEVDVADTSSRYQATLGVKLLAVTTSGVGAALHRRSTTTLGLAVGGTAAGLGAIAALFLGIQLSGR